MDASRVAEGQGPERLKGHQGQEVHRFVQVQGQDLSVSPLAREREVAAVPESLQSSKVEVNAYIGSYYKHDITMAYSERIAIDRYCSHILHSIAPRDPFLFCRHCKTRAGGKHNRRAQQQLFL
jgi:hypothetical protein